AIAPQRFPRACTRARTDLHSSSTSRRTVSPLDRWRFCTTRTVSSSAAAWCRPRHITRISVVQLLAASAGDIASYALAAFLVAVGAGLAYAFFRLGGTFARLSSF